MPRKKKKQAPAEPESSLAPQTKRLTPIDAAIDEDLLMFIPGYKARCRPDTFDLAPGLQSPVFAFRLPEVR